MTLNIASSRSFGSRPPSRSRIASSSSSVTPEPAMERLDRALGQRSSGARPRRRPAPRRPRAPRCSTSERMIPSPSSEPRIASAARSGCGISPATLPAAFDDAGDRPQRAVRVAPGRPGPARRPGGVDVAEQDLAVALERVERRVVGVVAALAVGDRHPQRPPRRRARG